MGPLRELLAGDHDRLDALLGSVLRADGTIDQESYQQFRAGLLWHIGIEEKVLFRELRSSGRGLALVEQLHRDHAALAALLMPPPTSGEIEAIRAILASHNPLEEEEGGMYDLAEKSAGDRLGELMDRIRTAPPVRLAPNADSEILRRSIGQLVKEAEEGRRRFGGDS